MLDVGAVIGGRFRVDRMLGAGGMGVVVAATHTELGQQVALKVLHDELAGNPTIVQRFLREARAVASLRTEHVCRVFDVGRLDSGAPFIVMEMLHGADLGSVVQRGSVAMVIAVEYVIQACVALAEAHAAGIVHRDLKPANLFVVRRPDGGPLVKVLDFGIAKAATAAEAKLTHTTSQMGSPGYMSPEQIRSTRDVDLRTDIWALGITLYQLLTGRMPFAGTQLAEIAVAVMTAAPPPLDGDPGLAAVVMKCLEKEPERRFQSVAELAVALMPYGGPSAPRFVSEITQGQVGGTAPSAPHVVPMHAPTAASYGTYATQHGTAPSPGAQAAPTVATSGRGKWVVLGVVLVGLIVGGGALAGYLVRGDSAATPAPRDAAVSIDAAAPAPVDAAPVIADAATGDPWAGRDPATPSSVGASGETQATPSSGEPQEADEPLPFGDDAASLAIARGAMGEYREQTLTALRGAEKQMKQLKRTAGAAFDQMVAGYAQTACLYGDKALALKYLGHLEDARQRRITVRQCAVLGVELEKK